MRNQQGEIAEFCTSSKNFQVLGPILYVVAAALHVPEATLKKKVSSDAFLSVYLFVISKYFTVLYRTLKILYE
jgi:hypothetical protein